MGTTGHGARDSDPNTRRDGKLWDQRGMNASGAAFFVGLFTALGTFALANTLAPDAPDLGKVVGALLFGIAAGLAVFAVIISIREAALPDPRHATYPSPPAEQTDRPS